MDYYQLADISEKHIEKMGNEAEFLYWCRRVYEATTRIQSPEDRARIRKMSTIPWRELYQPFTI